MEAASNIINIVRKMRARMVRHIEALCDAYIILANVDATPWKSERSKSSKNFFCSFNREVIFSWIKKYISKY